MGSDGPRRSRPGEGPRCRARATVVRAVFVAESTSRCFARRRACVSSLRTDAGLEKAQRACTRAVGRRGHSSSCAAEQGGDRSRALSSRSRGSHARALSARRPQPSAGADSIGFSARGVRLPQSGRGMDSGPRRPALPREVDEAGMDVARHELDVHFVADVQAVAPFDDLSLDRRPEDAHPRPLLRGAGDHAVEFLADAR